jgi:AraC family transcriptional activator of tynA and feaB
MTQMNSSFAPSPIVETEHSKAETLMPQRDGIADTPRLDFDAWRALLRSNCGGEVEVTAPKAFAGWMRPTNVSGLATAAVKIQWESVAGDCDCHVHRLERTFHNVRRDGSDHYLIVFQVAGQSVISQIDRATQLTVGDVALIDAARPVTFLSRQRNTQWLSLRLPRKSALFHLGFEPKGGLGRHETRAGRLLFNLIRDADNDSAFSPSDSYMQLAVYDLVGALFAPSDSSSTLRSSDKLFTRICGVIRDGFSNPDFGPCEVAAETGISLRYVQKLFTERGSACSEHIYSLRLDHAAHLLHRRALLGTRQPLSEIAYACGFRDYAHFARKFHHRFGCAPGAHAGRHDQKAGDRTVRAGTGESASSARDFQFRAS